MASSTYDIITVGGGLGGSALAKAMAEHGARVLMLEREKQFKDRVRGEVMVTWGVAETQRLGNSGRARTSEPSADSVSSPSLTTNVNHGGPDEQPQGVC